MYMLYKCCNKTESRMQFLNGDKGSTRPTLLKVSVLSNDAVRSLKVSKAALSETVIIGCLQNVLGNKDEISPSYCDALSCTT